MSTPVSVPTSNGAGGFTPGRKALAGSQLELVMRAAHAAMVASGLEITPMKTKRIVRRFEQALRRARVTFHQFLEVEADRNRVRMIDPSLAQAIAYMDRTGETAVNHVMHHPNLPYDKCVTCQDSSGSVSRSMTNWRHL